MRNATVFNSLALRLSAARWSRRGARSAGGAAVDRRRRVLVLIHERGSARARRDLAGAEAAGDDLLRR